MVTFSEIDMQISFVAKDQDWLNAKVNGTYADILEKFINKNYDSNNEWKSFVDNNGEEKVSKMLKAMQKEEQRYQKWKEQKHKNDIKGDESYTKIEYKGLTPDNDLQLYFASENLDPSEAQMAFIKGIKEKDGKFIFSDDKFKNWNKIRKEKTDRDDRRVYEKECKKVINSYLEKTEGNARKVSDEEYSSILSAAILNRDNQGKTEGDNKMADEFKISDEDRAFLEKYAEKSGEKIDFDNIKDQASLDVIMKKAKDAEKTPEEDTNSAEVDDKAHESEEMEVPEAANDNEPENVGLEKKEGAEEIPDEEWVKNMEAHWKGWCEDRDPKYEYERDKEKKGYAFKYYKTAEDKELNKHAVEVHYETQSDVKIKTFDGKSADLEFWKSFADAAKKNDQVVNFEKMGKEENKAKLYLACMFNGVDVKNVNVDTINFESAFKELNDEEKKVAQEKLGLDENGVKVAPETEKTETEEKVEEKTEEKSEEKTEEPKEYTLADIKILEVYSAKNGERPINDEAFENKKKQVVDANGDIKSGYISKEKMKEIGEKIDYAKNNMPEGKDKVTLVEYKSMMEKREESMSHDNQNEPKGKMPRKVRGNEGM